jgi:hypothetical protein
MGIRIGIDFDNTIVCYDTLFRRVALEQDLIPADLPENKGEVRDYLRAAGKEDVWTAMQGDVYGKRMLEAPAFPGVLDCLARFVKADIPVFIVSHKTRFPYLGPKYDLHEAALAWLTRHGIFDPGRIGLPCEHVFLELTKQAKMGRIATLKCTHFIDDLPELLGDLEFPAGVIRLLFDPNDHHPHNPCYARLASWGKVPPELMAA